MLRIDLQTHSTHSRACGWTDPETLVHRAEQAGLDGIAVTDHNTMAGVGPAREAAADEFVVIPGEEIDTPDGQVIGLFLSEPIDPWQPTTEVIERIHDQDGLVLVPHPFDSRRSGLESVERHTDSIDAVETLNARCIRFQYNERARKFAVSRGIPQTGGSDAHFAHELGTAYTAVETDGDDRTLDAIQQSIRTGKTTPKGSRGTILNHAGTKVVKLYNGVRRR